MVHNALQLIALNQLTLTLMETAKVVQAILNNALTMKMVVTRSSVVNQFALPIIMSHQVLLVLSVILMREHFHPCIERVIDQIVMSFLQAQLQVLVKHVMLTKDRLLIDHVKLIVVVVG